MSSNQENGFVYVLSNPAMPGLVKIGSSHSPEERVKQLYDTGVPLPFKIDGSIKCRDRHHAYEVERKVHTLLNEHRLTPAREFFQLPVSIAVWMVYKTAMEEYLAQAEQERDALAAAQAQLLQTIFAPQTNN